MARPSGAVGFPSAASAFRAPFGPPKPPAKPPPASQLEAQEFLVDTASYVQSYNAMLADHAFVADWEGALDMLQDMRSLGVMPDVTSYFACICACRRAGAWEEALHLLSDAWSKDLEPNVECYSHVLRACGDACDGAGEASRAERQALLQELRNWGPAPDAKRFHTTPMLKWTREMKQYGCGVRNEIDWQGEGPIPPPCGTTPWLLPSQDATAVCIAERQAELRHAGWRVVRVAPEVVATLRNKATMIQYAKDQGIGAFTPRTYQSALEAEYPCILKPNLGTFGKDTHVVRSIEEVERFTRSEGLARWTLQELVPGRLEYSTTLLVCDGEVVDYVNTLYEYDGEEYVWPFVEEVRHEYVSVPEDQLQVMRRLLCEFSGICCLGYKLRRDGSICIFEVNPRIGGDLVFECPKPRAKALFEKLDFMF